MKKLELKKNVLDRLYTKEGWSMVEISKKLKCNRKSVNKYLKLYGIPIRKFQDSIRLSHKLGRVVINHAKGDKHGNWKGGVRRHNKGYILIKYPEHHRAQKSNGYVYEHIVVWEETHKKELPKGWEIHHINGIKDDNRPENLKALPSRKHNKYALLTEAQQKICRLEKRIKELEDKYE